MSAGFLPHEVLQVWPPRSVKSLPDRPIRSQDKRRSSSRTTSLGDKDLRRVMLTGTYSSKNLGDAAMQYACARSLATHGIDVTIAAPFHEEDAGAYEGIAVVPDHRRRPLASLRNLGGCWLWRLVPSPLRPTLAPILLSQPSQTLRDMDLIVDLSGDMLTDDYGPHVALSHYVPLVMARTLGVPYVLCAQSIGPFTRTSRVAKSIIRGARWVSVRDDISRDMVYALTGQVPLETADMSLLLDPIASSEADAMLEVEGVDTTMPWIGVSVSGLIEAHYQRHNPAAPVSSFGAVIAETLDRLTVETGSQIVLIPHVTGPTRKKDDRVACRRVRDLLASPAQVLEMEYTPQAMKGIIANASLFIGARMHANLAALTSRVPTVAIAYSHKSAGLMGRFGQDEYVVPVETLTVEVLGAAARNALKNQDAIRLSLEQALAVERPRAEQNISLILTSAGAPS